MEIAITRKSKKTPDIYCNVIETNCGPLYYNIIYQDSTIRIPHADILEIREEDK